jgi:hypothetical protein
VVSNEDEHAFLVRSARSGTRVALDHALRGQEVFDLLTEHGNVIILLEPVGALLPKPKTLETKADACFATALRVWSFITFLATDSASIAARLGAHRAFSLGRSGLLRLVLLWRSWRDGSPWGGGGVVHSHGRE